MNSNITYVSASSDGLGARQSEIAILQNVGPSPVERSSHRQAEGRFRLRDLGPAAALLFIGMAGLLVATLSPTGKDDQYAVIAPPWYRLGETIALIQQADGGIVDMGGPANIIIARSENPNFVRALYAGGAWLVIDPTTLRGCVGFRKEA